VAVIASSVSDEAIQASDFLDRFAEPVVGPTTSGRSRWLAMTKVSVSELIVHAGAQEIGVEEATPLDPSLYPQPRFVHRFTGQLSRVLGFAHRASQQPPPASPRWPRWALPQFVAIDDCARIARHIEEDAALDKRVYAGVTKQDQRRTIIIAARIARDFPSLREQLL